ncbi:hypothetical protein PG985_003067 [Apiospora marii]|uniref:Uncharacterized protein n=1 Tax=Apiospora marii TaxID=335849 RepID=A0ABR1RUI4_9PEZI
MSQSDLYDFFSYVARDGKGNTADTGAMARRTSVTSSSSSSDESSAPTPLSTTTRATATPAPAPPIMFSSSSRTSSSSSSAAAVAKAQHHRLTADEITARILQSPEHHALCEMLSGRHDHDDDYARRSADKYRAFVDLATRLEAQKMPSPSSTPARFGAAAATQYQHEQARREWNSLWW